MTLRIVDVDDMKAYLALTNPSVDAAAEAFLGELCDAATEYINKATGRTFIVDPDAPTTRYFGSDDIDDGILYLGDYIAEVTAMVNTDTTEIPLAFVRGDPRNRTSWTRLKYIGATGAWGTDGEIAITGHWAYSLTPPEPIKQAARRLVQYWFRQRDTNNYEAVPTADGTPIYIRSGVPKDVLDILVKYRPIR